MPILWLSDVKNWLTGKDPDAWKDWRQEEKGTTEDEIFGWHHQLTEHWVWASSRSWWWTGKLGMLQSMGSQRVGHDWATELNWLLIAKKTKTPKIESNWSVAMIFASQKEQIASLSQHISCESGCPILPCELDALSYQVSGITPAQKKHLKFYN